MKTIDGQEMYLTTDAEIVAADLVGMGADLTSGYRDLARQARVMAVNTMENRHWIGQTYLRGRALQELVNEHSEATTMHELEQLITVFLRAMPPEEVTLISHHLLRPCPVFDIRPLFDDVGDQIKARIQHWQREGIVRQVLWKEGGRIRWHVEVAALPTNKVMEV